MEYAYARLCNCYEFIRKLLEKRKGPRVHFLGPVYFQLYFTLLQPDIIYDIILFRKDGYRRGISLKRRAELLSYQIKLIQEVLKDHGYAK